MRRLLALVLVVATPAVATGEGVRVDLSTGLEITDAFRERDGSGLSDLEAGFSLGLLLTSRSGNLELGGSVETVAGILGADMVRAGGVAGVVADLGLNQRFELLGEVGGTWFHDIGDGFAIESVEGETTATKLFAGGRVGYQHDVGVDRRLAIGAWLTYRRDLGTSEHQVVVRDCYDLCTTEMRTYDVGGSHWGFTFAVTWTPD